MKLSTGKVAFPIEFDNGDKSVIYFNPNDRGIQERIQGFEKSIEKRIKEIDLEKYKSRFNDNAAVDFDLDNPEKLLEMSSDELKALQNRLDAVNEIEVEYNKAVKDELDVVFGGKISDVAFRYCQPFDTVIIEDENGNEKREMYIMHFIHWLMVELKKYGAENKSAMDKHLAKYSK
ncbi:MAG: hypothetical protein U0M02_06980 [Acutalibacteraceae bacterium]|nr:hypothetical protein [Acutalibacteraceae bacterium]